MDKRPAKEVLDQLCRDLADKGLLIEAGWKSYRLLVLPIDAPAVRLEECRLAFYAGVQHLFGSLAGGGGGFFDVGEEPTEADLKRMSMIVSELDAFLDDFKRRHPELDGLPEPQGKPS